MNLFEFGGCEPFGGALEGLELVRDFEFFEEPEDAVRTGFLEPVFMRGGLLVS